MFVICTFLETPPLQLMSFKTGNTVFYRMMNGAQYFCFLMFAVDKNIQGLITCFAYERTQSASFSWTLDIYGM